MWGKIDKEINKYLIDYKKSYRYLKDDLQDIFNRIDKENINKVASDSEIRRFKRELERFLIKYTSNDYTSYKLKKMTKKNRLKNSELLEAYILMAYYNNDLDETTTLENSINIAYNDIVKECKKVKKGRAYPVSLIPLLSTTNHLGYLWKEFKKSNINYNADEIYRNAMIKISQKQDLDVEDFTDVLVKQQNKFIAVKKKDKNDKYYGYLDGEIEYLVNQVRLSVMEDWGIEKVLYIAEEDEKTCDVCMSLNGQTFYINDFNTYYVYNKEDNKNIKMVADGLVVGENYPPMHRNCRCYVYPIK